MDAVALAKEFAEDCIKDEWTRDDLIQWVSIHPTMFGAELSTMESMVKQIKVALDSKIIITIK